MEVVLSTTRCSRPSTWRRARRDGAAAGRWPRGLLKALVSLLRNMTGSFRVTDASEVDSFLWALLTSGPPGLSQTPGAAPHRDADFFPDRGRGAGRSDAGSG